MVFVRSSGFDSAQMITPGTALSSDVSSGMSSLLSDNSSYDPSAALYPMVGSPAPAPATSAAAQVAQTAAGPATQGAIVYSIGHPPGTPDADSNRDPNPDANWDVKDPPSPPPQPKQIDMPVLPAVFPDNPAMLLDPPPKQ